MLDALPDGLAFGPDGALYVGCYEPSAILRIGPDGHVEWLVHDDDAHTLCRPTNLAFRGATLFAANLGRWHVTALDARRAPRGAGGTDRMRITDLRATPVFVPIKAPADLLAGLAPGLLADHRRGRHRRRASPGSASATAAPRARASSPSSGRR